MNLQPIIPFEPVRSTTFPKEKHWICQVKWDGVRLLTYYADGLVRLFNRKRHERTKQYPELCDPTSYCKASSFILDGEVIALLDGKPSFSEVMKRDALKSEKKVQQVSQEIAITYMIFDILYYNGDWITTYPLAQRQQILEEMMIPQDHIQVVDNFLDGDTLFQAIQQQQMEGIIYKNLHSTYQIGGKDTRWIKRKVDYDLYAVVGGATRRKGRIKSLLLGLYDEANRLHFIGHAGTGKLTQQEWSAISQLMKSLQIDKCPFVQYSQRREEVMWLQPTWVVKVRYAEWLPSKKLRQPSIQAFVEKDPLTCTFMREAST